MTTSEAVSTSQRHAQCALHKHTLVKHKPAHHMPKQCALLQASHAASARQACNTDSTAICIYRGRPRSVVGLNGAVAADTGTCSQVGLDMLQAGGNAVDAGVVCTMLHSHHDVSDSTTGHSHIKCCSMCPQRRCLTFLRSTCLMHCLDCVLPTERRHS